MLFVVQNSDFLRKNCLIFRFSMVQELEYLLNSFKTLYIEKIGISMDNFEVSIKEIIYSKCKPLMKD